MVDVFIRVNCLNVMRLGMAITTIARWELQKDAYLHVVVAKGSLVIDAWNRTTIPNASFWNVSKQYAEDHATTDIYVLTDDDQLIIGQDWIENGIAALSKRPEYGMLCGWSITGEVPEYPGGDDEVFPVPSSIGAPYFVRKGTLGTLPESSIWQQDNALSEVVKNKGLKIGFLKKCRFNHLGAFYSGISQLPGHWRA